MSSSDIIAQESLEPLKHPRSGLDEATGSYINSTGPGGGPASQYTIVHGAKKQCADSTADIPLRDQSRSYTSSRRKRQEPLRPSYRSGASFPTASSASKPREKRKPQRDRMARDTSNGSKKYHTTTSVPYPDRNEKSSAPGQRSRGDSSRKVLRPTVSRTSSQDRVRPLVSPSLLSVLSALTGSTESSSGSNATITQRSYDYSKESTMSPPLRHRSRRSSESTRSVRPRVRPRHSRTTSKESIDVFKFLESDNSGNASRTLASKATGPPAHREESVPRSRGQSTVSSLVSHWEANSKTEEDEASEASSLDQHHSDSGVSVGGESPEFKRRTNIRYHSPTVEDIPLEDMAREQSRPRPPVLDKTCSYDYNMALTPPYHSVPPSGHDVVGFAPEPPSYPLYRPTPWTPNSMEPPTPPSRISGYDLLASRLSAFREGEDQGDDTIVPLYRRFEPLQHRVLLHLQDEISELEEQLERLDECIAQSQPHVDGVLRPASRREDVRFGDSLRYQRMDLLGRICVKLTSYSQALQAYTSMGLKAETATDEDIRSYKEWLVRHQAIEKHEIEFLDHGSDLFRVSNVASQTGGTDVGKAAHRAPQSPSNPGVEVKYAMMACPPSAVLLTLFVFLAIPTLFGRLVVLTVVAGVGFVLLGVGGADAWLTQRGRGYCVAAYVGVMAAIACVAR